jgi:hypothetical protein
LSQAESQWIEAQQRAWLSIWEVSAVEPGRSLVLEDLLTGETRTVNETGASQTLTRRDAILARVVDWSDTALLCGCHSLSLPPLASAEIVQRLRRRLRRTRTIPVERLRDAQTGRWLIARWEEAVAALEERLAKPPQLTNTDGEALLLTVDHFEFEPGSRAEVERRLAALPDVQSPVRGESEPSYLFTRPDSERDKGSTVIGRAEVSSGRLRLETNSRQRADRLRRALESACGELLHHRGREHSDPLSERVRAKRGGSASSSAQPDLAAAAAGELVREYKARHYATWIDQQPPALGGKTPRETVKTSAGRAQVDALLKDLEQREARLPQAEQFDVAQLRRALGLSDGRLA